MTQALWTPTSAEYDYPPFAGRPRVYAIASVPRSGSHYLGHLLGATKQLGSPLEYLHPVHVDLWQEKLGKKSFEEVLRQLLAIRTSPSGWFGFKAHWFQYADARREWDLDKLVQVDRFIFIDRKDELGQAVSAVIAAQTAAWMSVDHKKAEPVYDEAAITNAIRVLRRGSQDWISYFKAQGIVPIMVSY